MASILSPCLISYVLSEDLRNAGYGTLAFYGFFFIFLAIGIYFLISGIMQVIRDKKTGKIGILTYGHFFSIYKTGAIEDGEEELKAVFLSYLPDRNRVIRVEEIISFTPTDYKEGDFVQLKFYKGDVNILQVLPEGAIPKSILRLLKEEKSKDYTVIINGEVYTKEQDNNDYVD